MARATTQIETRLTGTDQTAAAFASAQRRLAAFERAAARSRNRNPIAGFGKTNLARGVTAGFRDVGAGVKLLAGGAAAASRFASGLIGATAGAAALGGVLAGLAAKKTFGTVLAVDELADAAQKVGLTANAYKRMNTVFEMIGLGGRELTENVILKMQKALGEKTGQDALRNIGLSLQDLSAMSVEERFLAIGTAVAGISDDIARVQAETDLFGRSGNQLDAIFRKGGAAFRDSYMAVGKIGGELSQGGIDAAGRFADAWQMAKLKAANAWQNLVTDMLAKFEANFGPIDVAMMSVFEKGVAEAKIFFMEIETNGPIVFEAFAANARIALNSIPQFWSAGLDLMLEDTLRVDKKIGNALGEKMAKGVLKLQGTYNEDLFSKAVESATTGPARKRFDELTSTFKADWKTPKLINRDAEAAAIRKTAAERIKADSDALKVKRGMEAQTSDPAAESFERGAQTFMDAIRSAEALASGSYEAFKLTFNQPSLAGGAPLLNRPLTATAETTGSGLSQLAEILSELKTIVNLKRSDARDIGLIRSGIEGIGVA